MKRSMLLVTSTLLFLTGCIPLSFYPLYTDVKKDTAFVPELVGCWKEINDGRNAWKITASPGGGTCYDLVWTDETGKRGEYVAYVVDIKGKRFLDIVPMVRDGSGEMSGIGEMSEMVLLHLVPMHTFWPLEIKENHLTARYMSNEWLSKHLKEKPLSLRHRYVPDKTSGETSDEGVLLTAKPKKLQHFFLKHLSTPGAYTNRIEFERS